MVELLDIKYTHTDANYPHSQNNNLNRAYVDGISITHGNPHKHAQTFITVLQENFFCCDGG